MPTVTLAVARAHRRRGSLATGWPPARWLGRLRPDPLKRLRLGAGNDPDARSSLPAASPAQRSQVTSAARRLAEAAAGELPEPWPRLVRAAAVAQEEALPDRLERAVAAVELPERRPRWWPLAAALQRVLAAVAVLGALWLAVLVVLGFLQLQAAVPLPEVAGFPLPTVLLAGGLALGLLLAALARWANGVGARRRARTAERALHRRIEEEAESLVVGPVRAELEARQELCTRLRAAAGERRGLRRRR